MKVHSIIFEVVENFYSKIGRRDGNNIILYYHISSGEIYLKIIFEIKTKPGI
jgi:hypothetical protein